MIWHKVLLAAVLLVVCMEGFSFEDKFDICDFFAGAGRLARGGRFLGRSCAACDIGYHDNPRVFDINSDAGFLFLTGKLVCICPIDFWYFPEWAMLRILDIKS